ncbi:MAG: ATP-binding protein, partial [Gemmatimonadota bacterium]|nr:ATP-binding protein [Gemmatimonadota bacterium]
LHGFLTDLEKTFRVLSLQRDVEFRIDQKGVLPDEVYWDADRINEVVGNLLSNAFKFTSGGESVTLCVEAVNHDVHLDVRDSGAGIAPEQLPYIFEKFYQANNQNSAAHAGTGLGLAIAKQIVLAHSGTISATSEPGVGTTFHITLPIRAATRLVPQERRPATAGALL